MTSTPTSPDVALPSSRTLLRSTGIAAAVAALLLVTIVLPAEYGVDPTGLGNALGLKQMGEIKQQLAREAAADAAATGGAAASSAPGGMAAPPASSAVPAPTPAAASAPAPRSDVMRVALAPNEGKEIKLAMRNGARVTYQWSTNRGTVNYDTHADRSAPPAIKYHGYAKGQGVPADSGVLVAAFDGMHGWFWRNRGREPVLVTLRTSGDYQDIREMK